MNEEEKKADSKKRAGLTALVIAGIICLFAVFAWWLFPKPREIGTSGIYTKEILEEKTRQVISMLNQNDFDALRTDASDEMQSVLTQGQIDQVRDQLGDDWGESVSVDIFSTQEIKQQGKLYAATQAMAVYENITVIYTVSFDQEMRLSGLYMKK